MVPLIQVFKNNNCDISICLTGQHKEMLDQVMSFFEIKADYNLNVMKPGQDLFSITSDIIKGLKSIFDLTKPDFMFVHGDTTTCLSSSIAAFYYGIKICHIEAGLRTFNKLSPFPEEMNRVITTRLADFHFAPTETSKENLVLENVDPAKILVTGNTVIDALYLGLEKINKLEGFNFNHLDPLFDWSKKIILVTGHRRENFGDGFINICEAIKEIAISNKEVQIIYPVHLNPNVQKPVLEILRNIPNVHLINPLEYSDFIWLMNKAYIILTDSGGVQEEAPSLGKPVLVMRETTERPEALKAGTVKLVGTNINRIVIEVNKLLNNSEEYLNMQSRVNPYGNGNAAVKIFDYLKNI